MATVANKVDALPAPPSLFERLRRKPTAPLQAPTADDRLKADLPYDGGPQQSFFDNGKGLLIQWYRWRPVGEAVGVVVLMHGVKAHLRLTWLAKRAVCLEGASAYRAKQYSRCLTPASCSSEVAQSLQHFLDNLEGGQTPTSSEDTCSSPHKAFSSLSDDEDDLQHIDEEERRKELFYQGSWIEAFVQGGLEVYGIDLQGHGRSDGWRGKRCTAESFDNWRDDCLLFMESVVRENHPALPMALIGVSLSGQVAMRIMESERAKDLRLAGVALLSPLLQIAPKLQVQPLKTIARLNHIISKISPDLPVPLPGDPEGGGHDWQRAVGDNDPYLCKGPFTSHLVSQTIIGINQARTEVGKIHEYRTTPSILLMHNWLDPINPAAATVEAYELLRESGKTGDGSIKIRARLFNCRDDDPDRAAMYRSVPAGIEKDETPLNLAHTIVNDIDNGYVFGIVADWIKVIFSRQLQ